MADGNVNGMELRIDKAGRIVVPKPLRERLGFTPDTALEALGTNRFAAPDGVQATVSADATVQQGSLEGANLRLRLSSY